MSNQMNNVSALLEWEYNPREVSPDAYQRLKNELELLGQFKPLLVTPIGTVLGGNMRLKAIKELGWETVWVSVISFKQKEDGLWYATVNEVEQKKRFNSEKDGMMEYAMADNDTAGHINAEKFANIQPEFNVDWSEYATNFNDIPTIAQSLENIAPGINTAADLEYRHQLIIQCKTPEEQNEIFNQLQQEGLDVKAKTVVRKGK